MPRWKTRLLLSLLGLICVSLDAVAVIGAEDEHRLVQQYDEGPCVLLQAREWPPRGLRLWFGDQLTLKCNYHAFRRHGDNRDWLDVGGTLINAHPDRPCFYGYNVALFDANGNLVGCEGKSSWEERLTREPWRVSLELPLPPGLLDSITHYKAAYYESDLKIGKVAHSKRSDEYEAGEAAEVKPAEPPRTAAFRLNTKHRTLLEKPEKDWSAYTIDGACTLTDAELPDRCEMAKDPPIRIGQEVKVDTYFRIRDDGKIDVYRFTQNFTNKPLHYVLFVAFFDDDGQLIACASTDHDLKPGQRDPAVTIDGVVDPNATSFVSLYPISIPRGSHVNVSSYKMTLYVYDQPEK